MRAIVSLFYFFIGYGTYMFNYALLILPPEMFKHIQSKKEDGLSLKAKIVFFFGATIALLIMVSITIPYVAVWWIMRTQSGEMNVVMVAGGTQVVYNRNSSLNVTLIAVYPRAAVEARSDVFTVQLAFLVTLNSNITQFIPDEFRVNFRSLNWTPEYYGLKKLSFHTGALENLYRYDNTGEIEPFMANDSITINAGRWPPVYEGFSDLTYFVGEVETLPVARLQGRMRFKNDSGGFWSVDFDMKDYPTMIYRINFPPTVWAGYGFSLAIVAVVSVNFIYERRRAKH